MCDAVLLVVCDNVLHVLEASCCSVSTAVLRAVSGPVQLNGTDDGIGTALA